MKQACVNKDHVVVGGSTWNSMGLESTLALCLCMLQRINNRINRWSLILSEKIWRNIMLECSFVRQAKLIPINQVIWYCLVFGLKPLN